MGLITMVKTLKKIDRECNKDEELKKRLEPWVKEMNGKTPKSRAEAELVANAFIEKYNKIKEEIEKGIRSEYENSSVRKIEQVHER